MSIEDLNLRTLFEVSALRLRDLIKGEKKGAKTPAASPEESEKEESEKTDAPREESQPETGK